MLPGNESYYYIAKCSWAEPVLGFLPSDSQCKIWVQIVVFIHIFPQKKVPIPFQLSSFPKTLLMIPFNLIFSSPEIRYWYLAECICWSGYVLQWPWATPVHNLCLPRHSLQQFWSAHKWRVSRGHDLWRIPTDSCRCDCDCSRPCVYSRGMEHSW